MAGTGIRTDNESKAVTIESAAENLRALTQRVVDPDFLAAEQVVIGLTARLAEKKDSNALEQSLTRAQSKVASALRPECARLTSILQELETATATLKAALETQLANLQEKAAATPATSSPAATSPSTQSPLATPRQSKADGSHVIWQAADFEAHRARTDSVPVVKS